MIQSSDEIKPFFNRKKTINCRGQLIDLSKPRVMGIVNVTPDSFYSASRMKNLDEVLVRVETILEQGGFMVDLGAFSSRPGAEHISAEREMSRLVPAVQLVRKHFPDVVISVDTFRADVAEKAVTDGGADIINDIAGGEMDPLMFDTVARLNVPYILMHMQGTPHDMQNSPHYKNVTAEVSLSLARRVDLLRSVGVKDIIIDPGFGFGKTLSHNFQLLNEMEQLAYFQLPILVGLSRKSMIYKLLNTDPEGALNGTTVLNTIALSKGADILRVHDVKEAVECVKLWSQLKN
jgi:dihydropteroate synthase